MGKENEQNLPIEAECQIMDHMDNDQALAVIRGEVCKEMYYVIPGTRKKGISLAGTSALVCQQAQKGEQIIDIVSIEITVTDMPLDDATRKEIAKRKVGGKDVWDNLPFDDQIDRLAELPDVWSFVLARAHAVDKKTGRGQWGIKIEDATKPFAVEHATSKAERNAQRKLLPPTKIRAFVEARALEVNRAGQGGRQSGKAGGNGKRSNHDIASEVLNKTRAQGKADPNNQADEDYAVEMWSLSAGAGSDKDRRDLLGDGLFAVAGEQRAWDGKVGDLSLEQRDRLRNFLLDADLSEERTT